MQSHRLVPLAVAGMVVGVMMGASFVTSGDALGAVLNRGTPVTRDPALISQLLRNRNKPVGRTTTATRTISAPPSNQPTPTKCDGVKAMLSSAIAKATELWDGSKLSAFVDAMNVSATHFCENPLVDSTHTSAPDTTLTINNHCEKLSEPRYGECVIRQSQGQSYP